MTSDPRPGDPVGRRSDDGELLIRGDGVPYYGSPMAPERTTRVVDEQKVHEFAQEQHVQTFDRAVAAEADNTRLRHEVSHYRAASGRIEDEIRACELAGDRAGTDLMLRHEVVRLLRRMQDALALPDNAERDAAVARAEELTVALAAVEALLPNTDEQFPIFPEQVRQALGTTTANVLVIPRSALTGEPVDWRARAEAAEAKVRAVEALVARGDELGMIMPEELVAALTPPDTQPEPKP